MKKFPLITFPTSHSFSIIHSTFSTTHRQTNPSAIIAKKNARKSSSTVKKESKMCVSQNWLPSNFYLFGGKTKFLTIGKQYFYPLAYRHENRFPPIQISAKFLSSWSLCLPSSFLSKQQKKLYREDKRRTPPHASHTLGRPDFSACFLLTSRI